MKAETQTRTSASIYSIYVVLALVNLSTVAFVLASSYRTSRDYHTALHENRRTSERLSRLNDVRNAAARVGAVTVDVFVTHDAMRQGRQLNDAVAQFDAAIEHCRAGLATDSGASHADYPYLQYEMGEMTEVAETILSIARDDERAAAAHLPQLHASLRNLHERLGMIAEGVRADQVAAFARQSATYDAMVRNGAILSLLIAIFVVSVTAHGMRVVRELGTAREREQYIEALQQRETHLQKAIAERDAQVKLVREREDLLLEAEAFGMIGSFTWDVIHDSVYWSDELCRILGVPPGFTDANYEKYLDRVHRDDRARIRRTLEGAMANPGRVEFEHRWVRPSGDVCLIRVKAKFDVDAEGRPFRMGGVIQDITKQHATMTRLRRHEQQLAEAQRIAHVGSWDWTPETGESTWSDELYRITGTTPATTTPSFDSYLALVHPEDRAALVEHQRTGEANRAESAVTEHRLALPGGRIVHVTLSTSRQYGPSGELLHAVGTVQDITERKRIEESLRLSEQRFALAAMATNEIIWDYDPATEKFWCNETFSERYGFSESPSGELSPETWLGNLDPDDRERVAQSFYDAITSGAQYWTCEYRARFHNGEYHHILDRGYLLRDEDGQILRVIGASQDIHERKRATIELAHLHQQNKHVLDSTADAIFGVDRSGRFNLVNVSGVRMFGWDVEEMLGKDAHQLLHHSHPDGSEYPSEDCPISAALHHGVPNRLTDVMWRKDGTSVPVEWSTNPMMDDDGFIIGAVITCTDITERAKVDRMKGEFVSTVSHELRTPLTAIRGSLGLLASGRVGEFPEKANRLLEIASSNTDRLVRLINDILDLEKIDSGKLTLSRRAVSVDRVINQAVDGVRLLLDRARIAIEVESVTDVITMDPDRIIQTLTNLLGNAIKFSPAGSTIRVSAQRNGSKIVFSVADEGRGIPADKLDAIFERFEQVDASDSRDKGGSGLGLAICRSIVRQHGGTIHAQSEAGSGATFVFTLPAPLAPSELVVARRRVLICDADESARTKMRTVLEDSGFEVREANRAEDLPQQVLETRPDVVLLDLCVPESNGFELLAQIRNTPATAAVPVVIMSLRRPEEIESLDGSCTWLPKPLSDEALLATLKCACDQRSKPRLLMVEDDLDLARVIATLFEHYDVEITHVTTGKEAIEVARRIRPDLLILDLVLPDIDGFAVVSALRTDDCCRSVPLFVYSALEPSPEQQEHLRLGRTEFLTKCRATPEELEHRVAALLSSIIDSERGGMFDAA